MSIIDYGDPQEVEDPNALLAEQDSRYQAPDIETDQQVLVERMLDRLAQLVPGWEAHDGSQETAIIESVAVIVAEARALARDVPGAVLATFATEVLGQPIRQPAPSTATVRYTAVDDAGYRIEAGWQLTVARTGDDLIGFEVLDGAVIAPGETSVLVQAVSIEEGGHLNGVTGDAVEADPHDWVELVEIVGASTGGADGQSVEQFLDGLRGLMQVVGITPVRAEHYATLVRWFWGGRVVALDLYDPELGTWGHPATVTLAVADDQGQPWSETVKDQMREWFRSRSLVGFQINVIDLTQQPVNVTATVTAYTGQDLEIVRTICEDAIRGYLAPARYRLGTTSPSVDAGEIIMPPESGAGTPPATVIRVNDLIGLLDRTRGVDHVDGVGINGAASDLTLDGLLTLPTPGDITVIVL